MQLLILSVLWILLLSSQTVCELHFNFGRNSDDSSVSPDPKIIQLDETSFFSNESSEVNNASVYRDEEGNVSSETPTSENSLTDQANSTLSNGNQSLPSTYSTSSIPNTSSIHNMGTLPETFNNKTHSPSSTQFSSSESSSATNKGTTSSKNSSILTTFSSNEEMNDTLPTTDDDEPEGVARGKPTTTENESTTTSQPQTIYEKTWELISDTYTLSILVPVAAGVVFATTIILTIATCRCIRRRCLRRRLRRKTLPDSVKSLRPSDRARLLAESSDDEF